MRIVQINQKYYEERVKEKSLFDVCGEGDWAGQTDWRAPCPIILLPD